MTFVVGNDNDIAVSPTASAVTFQKSLRTVSVTGTTDALTSLTGKFTATTSWA